MKLTKAKLEHLEEMSYANSNTQEEMDAYKLGYLAAMFEMRPVTEGYERFIIEATSMLKVHEDAIRQDYGNTNWECVKLKFETAKEAIKQWGEK